MLTEPAYTSEIVPVTPMDHDLPSKAGTIRTWSGRYVALLEPSPATINLPDIAHALAHVCRFGGHVPSFYSVAEHSLHVAAQLRRTYGDPTLALWGLLHDATEAYLGDMVRPLKQQMPGYRDAESNLARVIEQRFGLPFFALDDPRVKHVDNEILGWEMAMVRDCTFRAPSDPVLVTNAFIGKYYELRDAAGTSTSEVQS